MSKVKPKIEVEGKVALRAHVVIARAIEQGVRHGYRRAHKHTEAPNEEVICAQIEASVMNALDEVLQYSDEAG
jgi:hypothetical protein